MRFAKWLGFVLLWFPLFVFQELRARLRGDVVVRIDLPFQARDQVRAISRSFIEEFHMLDPSFEYSSSDAGTWRARGRIVARGSAVALLARVRGWATAHLPEGSNARVYRPWRRAT